MSSICSSQLVSEARDAIDAPEGGNETAGEIANALPDISLPSTFVYRMRRKTKGVLEKRLRPKIKKTLKQPQSFRVVARANVDPDECLGDDAWFPTQTLSMTEVAIRQRQSRRIRARSGNLPIEELDDFSKLCEQPSRPPLRRSRRLRREGVITIARLPFGARRLHRANVEGQSQKEIAQMKLSAEKPANKLPLLVAPPSGVTLHDFQPIRSANRGMLKQASKLFCDHGWPGRENKRCRRGIQDFLGLLSRGPLVAQTKYVAWASVDSFSGILDQETMFAAALISAYQYRGRRRCGVLEYITSAWRGAGFAILGLTRRFLSRLKITRLFAAADLSREGAFEAHARWGFYPITCEEWAWAGLYLVSGGDVIYMRLDLEDDGRVSQSSVPREMALDDVPMAVKQKPVSEKQACVQDDVVCIELD